MKNIIYTLLTIITLCCVSINANAITVRGARGCGKWIEFKTYSNQIQREGAGAWLLGYLSAKAVDENKDILKDSDNESLFLWVDNYCQANPLEDISDAGEGLFQELIKQKGLK